MCRRAAIGSGATTLLALAPRASHSLEGARCEDDRCAVSTLVASPRLPARVREALRQADELSEGWNALTSACSGQVCKVTSKVVRTEYLEDSAPLIALADEGALRAAETLALVQASDREAYVRNAMRFESSAKYLRMCANLAEYDPEVPPFPKGAYVAKGLKDESGKLLGLNLV